RSRSGDHGSRPAHPPRTRTEGGHRMIRKELSRDVVVVGAGVAGLAAADDLRRAGLSVAVFDAGDSPGVAWKTGASASGRSTPVPGERTTPVPGEEELRGT